MRRRTRSVLALLTTVVLLALGVAAQIAHERTQAPQPLTRLDPQTIRHIEVRCNTCTTRRFERSDDGWHMRAPYDAPADPAAVRRLLAVSGAPIRLRLDDGEHDPARLGLAPASIVVVFDRVTIEIGDEDPIEHDRYVRVGGELFRVRDRFSARLLEAPESEVADPKSLPAR